MTAAELLRAFWASNSPLRSSLKHGSSYREIADDAEDLARRWRQQGLQGHGLLALSHMTGLELLKGFIAAHSVGAAPLLGEADGVVEQDEYPVWAWNGETLQFRCTGRGRVSERIRDAAVLHTTSGSTGRERVVIRAASSLHAEAVRYVHTTSLTDRDSLLLPLPIKHSFGWGILMGALLAGCETHVPAAFSPRAVARAIDDAAATVVGLTPASALLLCKCAGRPKQESRLRLAFAGAGAVSAELDSSFMSRFGIRLARNYGSTETGATFSGDAGLPPGAIGRPMKGVSIMAPEPNAEGELVLELTPPVDGYLSEDVGPRTQWRTGDYVLRQDDGVVIVLRRLHDSLRINGVAIDCVRVERVIRDDPSVHEVYLLTLPRRRSPDVSDLIAVVCGAAVDVDGLRARCTRDLPSGLRPSRFVSCVSLPRNELGKVERAKLVQFVCEHDRRYVASA